MTSCCCLATINTSEVGIIERFGKFSRLAEAGCFCIACPLEMVVGKVSLRLQQLNVVCETKTKDNVFVTVHVSVQYQVIRESIYKAFYTLSNLQYQLTAYVNDVLRSAICALTLDHAFEAKEEISSTLKLHLQEVMQTYGYIIHQTLITDLQPDLRVRDAMNEINASKRFKEAAFQRAEGEKVVKVKRAEAEAESMYLSGVGVARSRKAIVDGLRDSIADFSDTVSGTQPKDVMDLLVLTQYFDTIHDIGQVPGTKTVFINDAAAANGSGGASNGTNNVRLGVLEANAARGGIGRQV